jgi:hypothetical protein
MKKNHKSEMEDELRPEYDLSKLKKVGRGIYAQRVRERSNIVILEPDVSKVFRNGKEVNNALRMLIRVAKKQLA